MKEPIEMIYKACQLVLGDKFGYSIKEYNGLADTHIINIKTPETHIIIDTPLEGDLIDSYCIQIYHHMRVHAHIESNVQYERYTVVINPDFLMGSDSIKLDKQAGKIIIPKPKRIPKEIIHVTIEHTVDKGQDVRVFHYKHMEDGVYRYAQKYHFGYGISSSSYGLVTDTRDPFADYIMCPHDFYPHACNEPIHHILTDKWEKSYYGKFIQAISPECVFLKLDGYWFGINLNQFFQRLKFKQLPQYIVDEWDMREMLGRNI